MRSFFIFLALIAASVTLISQDTINKTDTVGKKQGFWRKLDKNGKKIYEGRFDHDVPVGEFRYYYPGGELKAVSIMSDNGRRSKTISYYRNGRKMAEGIFIDEKKDSLWKFYGEYDGALLSEENYKEGKKDGISISYYNTGVKAEQTNWENGVRNGPWETYYTDGKLKLKCTYKYDMKDGPIKTYHMSGKIWLSGQYVNGDADGTWTYLTENGQVEKKEYFQKGLLLKTEEFIKKEAKEK